jgi:hypothetical protein
VPNPSSSSTGLEAIFGGDDNEANSPFAVVAGGCDNLAGTGSLPTLTGACMTSPGGQAVLGGESNNALDASATVSGGLSNDATALWSSDSGGQGNDAVTSCQAIPAAPINNAEDC